MRTQLIIGVLTAAALIGGCASKPAAPPQEKEVPLDASNIVEAQAAGYKIVNEKGKTLLCRKDPKVGSHVQFTTTCLTAQEWQQLKNDNRNNIEGMSHRRPPPSCSRNGSMSC
jgi:hypothetical protein